MRSIDADKLKKYIDDQEGRPFIGVTIGEAFKIMVDEQPTIEPKKGKWIYNPDPMAGEGFWRCSVCGLEAYDYVDFCPNCGADNRGGQDE